MEQYIIKGGNPLVGEVEIGGAKNAALAILAAAIMMRQLLSIIFRMSTISTFCWKQSVELVPRLTVLTGTQSESTEATLKILI